MEKVKIQRKLYYRNRSQTKKSRNIRFKFPQLVNNKNRTEKAVYYCIATKGTQKNGGNHRINGVSDTPEGLVESTYKKTKLGVQNWVAFRSNYKYIRVSADIKYEVKGKDILTLGTRYEKIYEHSK